MTAGVRVWCGALLVLAVVAVPAASAQSSDFVRAKSLYNQQDYLAAQAALMQVDRDALNAEQRQELDAMLAECPKAVAAQARAADDLTSADTAYNAGNWHEASEMYGRVISNPYATQIARTHAQIRRERIAEKLDLAEAAEPSGTVERIVVVEEPDESWSRPPKARTTHSEMQDSPAAEPAAPAQPSTPRRLTPTDQLRMRDELLWQRAAAKAQDLADRTNEAVASNDFVEARKLADAALQTIEAAARYAEPPSKYETARAQMLSLKDDVQTAASSYERRMAAEERAEVAARLKQRRELLEQQKRETIQQLFNSAEQLRDERRFSEAAEVLRQILRLDPSNVQAQYQLEVAEDYESFNRQRVIEETAHAEQRRALVNADEALIPWDYDILYPKNWLELTARRERSSGAAGQDPEELELARKLEEPLPEVRFDQTAFEQVVNFLMELTGVTILPDWASLDDALLANAREEPISLPPLVNRPFEVVLENVLQQLGGEVELAYALEGGIIRISTKEVLDRNKYTLIYDIRDLLATVPSTSRPDFQSNQNQGLGQQGQGGGGQSIFGDSEQDQDQDDEETAAAEAEQIIEIIRQNVEQDSWVDEGAGPGGATINEMNGQLIIYQTARGHGAVTDLLQQLRDTQALQVSVESRFLDVTANFLEQFGVDLDFVFNSGSAGYDRAADLVDPFTGAPVLIPRTFSRIGALPATPGVGTPLPQGIPTQSPYGTAGLVPASGGIFPAIDEMTPISAQQGSFNLVDPTQANTGIPGSFAQRSALQPALNIAGSFLDNLQVDFLIRATQANQRSSIAQAPRAVLTNGQSVEIRIEAYRRYVSSLEPVVGENAALPRPIPADATSGVSMWVQATVSADRRYTKLSIALLNQGEPSFERYELQRGSGNSPSIFLLLPSQSRITFTTTVSIPDGGTVLLGGFKQVGEVEIDAGVPILSKIPVLKRAFTNQVTVKDTRTLLILVKSKILVQEEAEQEAFPTFSRGN